jgi:hypothetical protein
MWFVVLIVARSNAKAVSSRTGGADVASANAASADLSSHCQQVGRPMQSLEEAQAYANIVASSLRDHPVENTSRTVMIARTMTEFSVKADA